MVNSMKNTCITVLNLIKAHQDSLNKISGNTVNFFDEATVIEPIELKEWFIEKYENALREQKRLIDQRKENVKDMLMNVPRVNPDYGKDMDKDLFNARDNALTEQLNKDFPRNNPYKNINPNEGLNMPKPEINREKSQSINEQLKKLRERVGN